MNYIEILAKHGVSIGNEERQNKFRINIFNIIPFYRESHMPTNIILSICQEIGVPCEPFAPDGHMINTGEFLEQILFPYKMLKGTSGLSFHEFLVRLSIMLKNVYFCKDSRLKRQVKKSLQDWGLQYDFCDGVFIPKGVEEFDKALVADVADWLHDYPTSYKLFITALQQYANNSMARDIADNLRKSFEAFLQAFLCNSKNLESNISEVGAYLKSKNSNEEIRNMFTTLITHYKKLNDKTAKHNDKTEKSSIEFLLYQTGIFMRYLLTLHNTSETESD